MNANLGEEIGVFPQTSRREVRHFRGNAGVATRLPPKLAGRLAQATAAGNRTAPPPSTQAPSPPRHRNVACPGSGFTVSCAHSIGETSETRGHPQGDRMLPPISTKLRIMNLTTARCSAVGWPAKESRKKALLKSLLMPFSASRRGQWGTVRQAEEASFSPKTEESQSCNCRTNKQGVSTAEKGFFPPRPTSC